GGGGRAIRGGTLLAGLRRGKEGDRVVAGEQAEEGRGPQLGKRGGNAVSPQPPGPGVDPLVGGQRGGNRQVPSGQPGGAGALIEQLNPGITGGLLGPAPGRVR